MSGEEKNKLDELFKNGLAQPDTHFEYNSADWDNMAQLMDAQAKPRGIAYLWPMLSGIAAALLIFLGWWFLKPATVETAQVAVIKHPAVQHTTNQPSPVATVKSSSAGQPLNSSATQNAAVAYTATAVNPAYHIAYPSNKVIYAGNKAPHTGKAVPVEKPENNTPANGNGNTQQIAVTTAPDKTQQTATLPVTDPSQGNTSTTTIAAVTNPATTQSAVSAPDTAMPAAPDNTKKVKASISGSRGRQLGLAIMLSPDVNGAGSFQDAKVGTNVGLMFSAGVSKNLTISIGAAYSKKPYLTSFSNYTTTYKFKTDPTDVYADCRVLDIPINVDYKVYSRSKNSFSLGTGLSSYIMLNERYTYDYADPATAGPADYVVTNKNRHLFGVMNLNATYEHQVNAKMSIAAQPYLKVPLTDIGYSKVRLQSAGVAVGVRWKLSK